MTSACRNYEEQAVPSLETKVKQAHPQKHHQEKTDPGAESSGVPPSEGGESGETGEESEHSTATGGTSGDHGDTGNGQQGHKQGASNKGGKPSSDGKQAIANASGKGPQTTPLEPNSSGDSGGGSSPLVWIIIAIAVLAAISIGAFVIRQRRQGGEGGTSVSPKAS